MTSSRLSSIRVHRQPALGLASDAVVFDAPSDVSSNGAARNFSSEVKGADIFRRGTHRADAAVAVGECRCLRAELK